MRTLLAVLLLLPATLFAREVRNVCHPKPLNVALSVADHELWGKGLIRNAPELAVRDYGCGGMYIDDFVTSAEAVGGARVRVTFAFTITNEAAVARTARFRVSIVLKDSQDREREMSSMFSVGFPAGGGTDEPLTGSFLVPEADMRLPPRPTLRVEMAGEDAE